MANECIPLFQPGADITGQCSAAVTGKRVLRISATRDATTGLIVVANVTVVTQRPFGIAAYDVPINGRVPILKGKGQILPVTAGAAIAFDTEVESDTSGRVITAGGTNPKVGRTVEAASGAGVDVFIELY
jgi:hypothetical protein